MSEKLQTPRVPRVKPLRLVCSIAAEKRLREKLEHAAEFYEFCVERAPEQFRLKAQKLLDELGRD